MTQNQIKRDSDSAVITTHNRTYDTRLNNYHLLTTSNITGATTRTYTYVYNDKDQRTKLTLADGSYWEYTYDDKGQVISGVKKDSNGNAIAGQYFGYEYDGIGNRKWEKRGLAEMKIDYTSNNVNQYTQIDIPGVVPVIGEADVDAVVKALRTDEVPAASTTQQAVTTTRDGKYFSGGFTGIDNSAGPVTVDYNVYAIKQDVPNNKELIRKEIKQYTIPQKAQAYTYDTDGNMTSDGTWTYTYNGENRPVTVINADNTKKFEYKYDYAGRRIEEKYYTSSGTWTLAKHLKFVYEGFKKIAEYDGSDNLLKLYTWQPIDLDVPLWVKDGSTYYFYIVDGNKNVRSMVDSSGNEVASYDYNPFGVIVSKSGAYADTNMYRFSSEYYNPILKSSDYGLRDYKFVLGRWLTRDPIGERGGHNLYGMVNNNPINYWDILGLIKITGKERTCLINAVKNIINKLKGTKWGKSSRGSKILSAFHPSEFIFEGKTAKTIKSRDGKRSMKIYSTDPSDEVSGPREGAMVKLSRYWLFGTWWKTTSFEIHIGVHNKGEERPPTKTTLSQSANTPVTHIPKVIICGCWWATDHELVDVVIDELVSRYQKGKYMIKGSASRQEELDAYGASNEAIRAYLNDPTFHIPGRKTNYGPSNPSYTPIK